MSQWCVLPWGQHCSRLLHGDFLQEGWRHLWACSCHHSSNCHWRRMYEHSDFSNLFVNRSKRVKILSAIYPSICALLIPLTLLSLISSVILLFIVLLVFRRRRDTDSELSLSRAPLLRKDRSPCHVYGVPCDSDPVYAGWWHTDSAESSNKDKM